MRGRQIPRFPGFEGNHLIRLAAAVGDVDLALRLVRNSQYYGNYRWLVTDPDMAASTTTQPSGSCSMNCTLDGSGTSLSSVPLFPPTHPNCPGLKLTSRKAPTSPGPLPGRP